MNLLSDFLLTHFHHHHSCRRQQGDEERDRELTTKITTTGECEKFHAAS